MYVSSFQSPGAKRWGFSFSPWWSCTTASGPLRSRDLRPGRIAHPHRLAVAAYPGSVEWLHFTLGMSSTKRLGWPPIPRSDFLSSQAHARDIDASFPRQALAVERSPCWQCLNAVDLGDLRAMSGST